MPSYAPAKIRSKPLLRRAPRSVPLDWVIRTTNATALLSAIKSDDPHVVAHINMAIGHLSLLRNAINSRAYGQAHKAAARELAIAFYLLEPKQGL